MSRSLAVALSLALGAAYLVIGVLGFLPGITLPSSMPGQRLLLGIFAVNTVHNLAHLVLGLALIWAATTGDQLRMVHTGLAAVFAVLVIGSLVAPMVEGVAINPPDTGLHLASLALTATVGFWSMPRSRSVAAA